MPPTTMCSFLLVLMLVSPLVAAQESTCYGTTAKGKLHHGVKLPSSGNNYKSYGFMANALGRTYVHSTVKDIVVSAYQSLEKEQPNKVYKYAETGFQEGGKFRPHKTHQNGLSMDFMTPVINSKGQSVHLPTNMFNKYGYGIEFDEHGQYKDLSIDYEAMAAHIVALHKQAQKHGHELWRVIFDPKLQPHLFNTKHGTYLKKHIQFSKKRSWVRHDEHYHVDFSVPCEKL